MPALIGCDKLVIGPHYRPGWRPVCSLCYLNIAIDSVSLPENWDVYSFKNKLKKTPHRRWHRACGCPISDREHWRPKSCRAVMSRKAVSAQALICLTPPRAARHICVFTRTLHKHTLPVLTKRCPNSICIPLRWLGLAPPLGRPYIMVSLSSNFRHHFPTAQIRQTLQSHLPFALPDSLMPVGMLNIRLMESNVTGGYTDEATTAIQGWVAIMNACIPQQSCTLRGRGRSS